MDVRSPVQVHHEEAFVKSFIVRERQERCLYLIAEAKRRSKFTAELSHFKWFDTVFTKPARWQVDPSLSLWDRHQQGIENILKLLRSKGARETCWVISPRSSKDAKELNLHEALTDAQDCILSCVPGRLAYFQGEDESLLLERSQSAHS